MSNYTPDLQLRTTVAGIGTSHLSIEDNSIIIHEAKELGPEHKTQIFLSTAQWGDLAEYATKMASELSGPNDERHMTNKDVLAWQNKVRLDRIRVELGEVLRYFFRAGDFVMGGLKDQSIVDALVSAGELDVKDATVQGREVKLYRINSRGRRAVENEDYS